MIRKALPKHHHVVRHVPKKDLTLTGHQILDSAFDLRDDSHPRPDRLDDGGWGCSVNWQEFYSDSLLEALPQIEANLRRNVKNKDRFARLNIESTLEALTEHEWILEIFRYTHEPDSHSYITGYEPESNTAVGDLLAREVNRHDEIYEPTL